MASNYTPNYQLCQWEAEDPVRKADFNTDNARIDAAIKAVDSRVTGLSGSKASTSALNSLKSTVDSLSATVAGHTGALSKKGNCVLYSTTYVGNGKSGAANKRTLTFPHKPAAVLVTYLNMFMIMVQGSASTAIHTGMLSINNALTWSGNSVSWYCTDANTQNMMNNSGVIYHVVALLDGEN